MAPYITSATASVEMSKESVIPHPDLHYSCWTWHLSLHCYGLIPFFLESCLEKITTEAEKAN